MKDIKEILKFLRELPKMIGMFNMPTGKVDVVQSIREIVCEWKGYKDLEEQGKLLKLPCAVGDAVYRINKGAREPIISMEVVEIGTLSLKTGGLAVQITCRDNIGRGEICYLNSDFGRNIFISREEAEAALKEL